MKTVTLGGRQYVLPRLPYRATSQWRALFNAKISPLVDLLANANRLELNSSEDIASVAAIVRDVLIVAPDTIFDLLCAFVPDIAADRERIENEAYEDEVITAFMEVLRLAYPFETLVNVLTGRRPHTTSPN